MEVAALELFFLNPANLNVVVVVLGLFFCR